MRHNNRGATDGQKLLLHRQGCLPLLTTTVN
jgi:hypothetical protein